MNILDPNSGVTYISFFPTADTTLDGVRYVRSHLVASEMGASGSSFEELIGMAFLKADSTNAKALLTGFSTLFETFASRVSEADWLTHEDLFKPPKKNYRVLVRGVVHLTKEINVDAHTAEEAEKKAKLQMRAWEMHYLLKHWDVSDPEDVTTEHVEECE